MQSARTVCSKCGSGCGCCEEQAHHRLADRRETVLVDRPAVTFVVHQDGPGYLRQQPTAYGPRIVFRSQVRSNDLLGKTYPMEPPIASHVVPGLDDTCRRPVMPQSQEERNQPLNSFLASPMMQTPLFAIVAEMNGTLLETMATAQKEWANFVDRRIKEDVAVLRQLMQCRSPADMHRVYSDYFETAFEQYQEQSARVARRGQSIAEHLAETVDNRKEAARSRH